MKIQKQSDDPSKKNRKMEKFKVKFKIGKFRGQSPESVKRRW